MIEYSSPNTNKPLHLGHIRNNLLGYSVAQILKANGHNAVSYTHLRELALLDLQLVGIYVVESVFLAQVVAEIGEPAREDRRCLLYTSSALSLCLDRPALR